MTSLTLALLWTILPTASDRYVYVVDLTPTSVELAWGPASSDFNSIGRGARPMGTVEVKIDGRSLVEETHSWRRIEGLKPDSLYRYQVFKDEEMLGEGSVRTYPQRTDRLAFLVIGDYGHGDQGQYQLAGAMAEVFRQTEAGDHPIRFVMTTGDNIYGTHFGLKVLRSGNRDGHWEDKFFRPYRSLIASIPFRPTPGNHDGSDSESKGDFEVYTDNFFLPPSSSSPGSTERYYSFRYADLAEFFSIDSTKNSVEGDAAAFAVDGPQHMWLLKALETSPTPWKIVSLHHPLYCAGPRYGPAARVKYLEDDFRRHGVQAVFSGHEHNFQVTRREETGGILYVVSGGGSSVRRGNIQKRLAERKIDLWAREAHFLLVTIERDQMKIVPYDTEARPLPTIDRLGREAVREIRLPRIR